MVRNKIEKATKKYCVLEDTPSKDNSHHPIWLLLITIILVSLLGFAVYNDRISDLEQKSSIAPPDQLAGAEWKCTNTIIQSISEIVTKDNSRSFCAERCFGDRLPNIIRNVQIEYTSDSIIIKDRYFENAMDLKTQYLPGWKGICLYDCLLKIKDAILYDVPTIYQYSETICTEKTLTKKVEEKD